MSTPHETNQTPPTRRSRRGSFARLTSSFALSLSLFVHIAGLLVASVVLLDPPASNRNAAIAEGELALIADADLSEIVATGLEAEIPSDSAVEVEDPFASSDVETAPGTDQSALDRSDIGDLGGSGDITSGGGAFGGGASFFGVEAQGNRFAFILDISGSMANDRLDRLKQEVERSLNLLHENAYLSVVLYNSEADPLTGERWRAATLNQKKDILKRLNSREAVGGTNPMSSFELIFELTPKPDAIYLMTDGLFEGDPIEVAQTIVRLNNLGDKRSVIHCITLVEDGAADAMRIIAEGSGGTYTHISGRSR